MKENEKEKLRHTERAKGRQRKTHSKRGRYHLVCTSIIENEESNDCRMETTHCSSFVDRRGRNEKTS